MMYYVYLIASAVGDLVITMENRLVESINDIWKPAVIFPLLFMSFVLLHAAVISVISLFAGRNRKWTTIDNIYRRVTLETIDLMVHIMKARVHVSGEELLPKDKRFLLIGNHLSIYDPMIEMLAFKDKKLAFVSKKENIKMPFFGRLMLASGCLALDRENNRDAVKTIKQASAQISGGISSMGIYPEGGINKTDDLLLPFHSGSFKIAKKSGAPIVVAVIRNSERLCRRFLFAATDVYLDIIQVIQPQEYASMNTAEISGMIRSEMYEHLSVKFNSAPESESETDMEDSKAAC